MYQDYPLENIQFTEPTIFRPLHFTALSQNIPAVELTSKEETDIICSAIWHHDNKAEIDSLMDEVLKEADVIHHSLGDPTKEVKPHEQVRYDKLCMEFGL